MLPACQKAVKLILLTIRILQFHMTVFPKMGHGHMFLLLSPPKVVFHLFQTALRAFTCSNASQSAHVPVLFTIMLEEEELSMGS